MHETDFIGKILTSEGNFGVFACMCMRAKAIKASINRLYWRINMNKKVLLFILLQLGVFSANATVQTIYAGGDTVLNLNTPIPWSDQVVVFADAGDNLGATVAPDNPINMAFNNSIQGSDVLATFTLNRFSGFQNFSLTFAQGAVDLLTINQSDFTVSNLNGTYQLVLNALGTGNFTATMGGNVLANASSFTFRVDTPAAVPVPAAVWLFGSALVGLVTVGRRRKVLASS